MNTVVLIGRLTDDPEIRTSADGKIMAIFTLAWNKDKDTAQFYRIKAFDKKAELIRNYTSKGSMVGIEGRLDSGSYENKEGKKIYYTDVIVNGIDFLSPKSEPKPEPQSYAEMNDPSPYDWER